MLFTVSEGRRWRYGVCEHSDGYLVQMRDLESGELEDEFATIFRTMPVAFAFAEMSAAFGRFASAELENVEVEEIAFELEESERNWVAIQVRGAGRGPPALHVALNPAGLGLRPDELQAPRSPPK